MDFSPVTQIHMRYRDESLAIGEGARMESRGGRGQIRFANESDCIVNVVVDPTTCPRKHPIAPQGTRLYPQIRDAR